MNIDKQFPQLNRRVCTVLEFAHVVHTGENRVREYIRTGAIRAIKHGRRIVIPIDEIDRFLEEQAS